MKKILILNILLIYLFISRVYGIEKLNLNAKNAILIDRESKRILYEKNAYEKVPNASTTKVLTAILIAERCDLTDIVEIGENSVKVIGSKVKFNVGDKITVGDLLKGLLLCSGNDAAIALAEYLSGNIADFSNEMNKKAKSIGAKNTNFTTPHGLDNDKHYSTAYDLAIISDYAMNNKILRNIFKKQQDIIYINGVKREIRNTNEMLRKYSGTDGIKTGFTNQAGRCLITSSTNNQGRQLISVVLNCESKNKRTEDSIKLLNYGFENYELVNITEKIPSEIELEIKKGKSSKYIIKNNLKILYPLAKEEKENLNYKININKTLVAPIKYGENILDIEILCKGERLKKININLKNRINNKNFFENIYLILNKKIKIRF